MFFQWPYLSVTEDVFLFIFSFFSGLKIQIEVRSRDRDHLPQPSVANGARRVPVH
jgi:hypothetical protein